MIISIHQPNFMPWSSFFEKVKKSDLFIVMGHCQYEKNGYQNRFNIKGKWYTMSTARGLKPIVEKKYVNPHEDWETIKRKLPNYKPLLEDFDHCITEDLYDTNYKIIKLAAQKLNIKTKIIKDYKTNFTSTDRLVALCKNFSASVYLSGPSGRGYIDSKKFEKANIKVKYQQKITGRPLLEELNDVL